MTYLALIRLVNGGFVVKVGYSDDWERRRLELSNDAKELGIEAVWGEIVLLLDENCEQEMLTLATPIEGLEWFSIDDYDLLEEAFLEAGAEWTWQAKRQGGRVREFDLWRGTLTEGDLPAHKNFDDVYGKFRYLNVIPDDRPPALETVFGLDDYETTDWYYDEDDDLWGASNDG